MPANSPAPSPPPLGVENYRLGVEISTGGMGSVLEAHDAKLDRTVAIKVMRLEANTDAHDGGPFPGGDVPEQCGGPPDGQKPVRSTKATLSTARWPEWMENRFKREKWVSELAHDCLSSGFFSAFHRSPHFAKRLPDDRLW